MVADFSSTSRAILVLLFFVSVYFTFKHLMNTKPIKRNGLEKRNVDKVKVYTLNMLKFRKVCPLICADVEMGARRSAIQCVSKIAWKWSLHSNHVHKTRLHFRFWVQVIMIMTQLQCDQCEVMKRLFAWNIVNRIQPTWPICLTIVKSMNAHFIGLLIRLHDLTVYMLDQLLF